jgi:hypothetical protein
LSHVSVSVRPGRLGVSGSTRDAGHHSRFVQCFLLLAAAAPALGFDGVPVGSRPIELSHYPRLRGARVAREIKRRPFKERAEGRTALHGYDCVMRQGAHHWAAALAKSGGNPRRCLPARSVTTGKPLVTLLLPQTNCRRNADKGWRRDRAGRGHRDTLARVCPRALRVGA